MFHRTRERENGPGTIQSRTWSIKDRMVEREKGNGHEKIDEIGNHQKAYGAGMETSIASRVQPVEGDEINFNFREMWFSFSDSGRIFVLR